jgi:hypothetical protein
MGHEHNLLMQYLQSKAYRIDYSVEYTGKDTTHILAVRHYPKTEK